MPAKLSITDKRMLQLPGILQKAGMITFLKEFQETAGIQRQNITSIKNGRQHFTVSQIDAVGKKYQIDFNWIFGAKKESPFLKT